MLMTKIHTELIEEIFDQRKKNPQEVDLKDLHEECQKTEN